MERVTKLRAAMAAAKLDAILLHQRENIYYISGFTGDEGSLWITGQRACLLVDSRFTEQASLECADFEIIPVNDPFQIEACWAQEQRIGFEADDLTAATFFRLKKTWRDKTEWVTADQLLRELRLYKDEDELQYLRKAVELADRAFEFILPQLKPGVRERDIALEMEYFMRREGATGASFDFIIAGGPRSSLIHGVASDAELPMNGPVLMDFGCIYRHYCSDITRTVFLGQPSHELKKLYEVVREGQKRALEASLPGTETIEVDRAARRYFAEFGWDKLFGHGLGHGVGLEIHEAPTVNSRLPGRLEPGMVYTLEPGVYLPGRGGVRIEDMVLMTKEGPETLTQASKELIIL